jgi:hypothetical protein
MQVQRTLMIRHVTDNVILVDDAAGKLCKADWPLIKVQVLQAYEALTMAMEVFTAALKADRDLPAHVDCLEGSAARQRAAWGYAEFYTSDDLKFRPNVATRTLTVIGAIGASAEVLALAAAVNHAKQNFKTAMVPLAKKRTKVPDPDDPNKLLTVPVARLLLQELGLGGLKQRQVIREIPLLDTRPRRLTYMYARRSHTVEKISRATAFQRLDRLDEEAEHDIRQIKSQKRKLARIDDRYLAVCHDVDEHVRVNVYPGASTEKTQHKWRLPVLYPAQAGDPPVRLRWPATPDPDAPSRGEIRIIPGVYLPSINAYRYLKPWCYIAESKASPKRKPPA